VLTAAEVDRLRSPIGSAMHSLEVDEIDRGVPEADRVSPQLEAVDLRLIRAKLAAEKASTCLDVPARFSCPDANQLRQVMDQAAGRLGDLIRRRDAATPAVPGRQRVLRHGRTRVARLVVCNAGAPAARPTARTEPAITATLQLTDRDHAHLREQAAHRRHTITKAARRWPTGRGGRSER
jgi:hypothetical protein